MMTTAIDTIRACLAQFETLNVEMIGVQEERLWAAADEAGPAFFEEAAAFAEKLVAHYLESAVKRQEKDVLAEYFEYLDRAANRLIESGALALPEAPGAAEPASLALVPRTFYDSLGWLKLVAKSNPPVSLQYAVDAAQRRNFLVESVLEPMFRLLQRLDRDRAFAWELALCGKPETPTDPDIARDLLRAWQAEDGLPPPILEQALRWTTDETSYRHWPAVPQEADRLLRRLGLERWLAGIARTHSAIEHLRLLAPFRDERKLLRWLQRASNTLGQSVAFFTRECEALTESAADDETGRQRRAALFQELRGLQALQVPLLLLGDLILSTPTGASDFALTFFGFTAQARQSWRDYLVEKSRKVVHRTFLMDLRGGRPPMETIHRLSFGDDNTETALRSELDFISGEFDSYKQFDLVVDRLAHIYAGRREGNLLSTAVGRLYRRLMRVLHEDNLRNVLTAEQMADLEERRYLLLDLAVMAAECRRFLGMRRALDRTLEEIVASEANFVVRLREMRAAYLRRLLDL